MSFVTDISNTINRRKAKYTKKVRDKDPHGIIDLTSITQQNKASSLRSTIGNNNRPIFEIVQEDKDGSRNNLLYRHSTDATADKEYDKINDIFDPNADQWIINQGATLIRSEITLTDSSGNNRVLVRRDNEASYH